MNLPVRHKIQKMDLSKGHPDRNKGALIYHIHSGKSFFRNVFEKKGWPKNTACKSAYPELHPVGKHLISFEAARIFANINQNL